MPDEPAKSRNGIVGAILTFFERWMDKPWKALFVLAAVLVGGIGFVAYQEREALLKVLLHKQPAKAVMRTASTSATLTGLFYTTHIDAASIWALNLHDNTAEYLTGRRRDGTPWLITPRILKLFTESSNPAITKKLLQGEPVCADPAQSRMLLGQALVDDGEQWVCFVPEPPTSTELLVGYVLLGFKDKPSEAVADAAVAAVLKQTDEILIR